MNIHIYAESGNIDGVQAELNQGVDIDSLDNQNHTPLMRALASKDAPIEMVRFLLNKGADVNITTQNHLTTILDNPELPDSILDMVPDNFKDLLKSASELASKSDLKENPLKIAVKSGNLEKVKLLVSAGTDIHYHSDDSDILINASYGSDKFGVFIKHSEYYLVDNNPEKSITT